MVSRGRWVADRPMRWSGRTGWTRRRHVAARVAGRPAQALETLQAQREVGAALGPGDGVDLVHDDLLDVPQDLARLAGQQQVEALGRGDEDVRRVADEVSALVGRGVAGAARDRDARRLLPRRCAASVMPASGARRLRSTS